MKYDRQKDFREIFFFNLKFLYHNFDQLTNDLKKKSHQRYIVSLIKTQHLFIFKSKTAQERQLLKQIFYQKEIQTYVIQYSSNPYQRMLV